MPSVMMSFWILWRVSDIVRIGRVSSGVCMAVFVWGGGVVVGMGLGLVEAGVVLG